MILLWSLLIAANILAIAAGAQAVALLRARDGLVAQLQGRVEMVSADLERTEKQVEAQKILLIQAQSWMQAIRKPPADNAAAPAPAPAASVPETGATPDPAAEGPAAENRAAPEAGAQPAPDASAPPTLPHQPVHSD